jgi:hypothetical protein
MKNGKEENPYLRRSEKVDKKAFKSVEQSVKPVAKDTNKTRRKETLKRKETANATAGKGGTLKSDMKKPMMNKKAGSLKCRKM